jgi:hypothetical protein
LLVPAAMPCGDDVRQSAPDQDFRIFAGPVQRTLVHLL